MSTNHRIALRTALPVIVLLIAYCTVTPPNSSASSLDIVQAPEPYVHRIAAPKDEGGGIAPEIQRLRNKSRSRITLKSGRRTVEIFLFAEDEQVDFLRGLYCGGDEGDKQYSGNYQLMSVLNNAFISSVINLGRREFTEGRVYDGIQEFPVPGRKERLLAIYQYRSCNGDEVEFYRVDKNGRLNKVLFLNKDGSKTAQSSGDVQISGDQLTFCSYNNALGSTFCDSYVYKGENFIQTVALLGPDLPAEKGTIIPEVRRTLFDYLIALYHGKYEAAVYYYAGSYDFLKQQNPDVGHDERAKLFERYCTANGGKCLIPEGMVLKDKGVFDEMKFTVSFVTRDWQGLRIGGKSEFEFRVKRVGNDFKVLDLPPYVPESLRK